MSTQTQQPFTVQERTTAVYIATIKDENDVGIPAASLTTLTLTLYTASGTIINSRDGQNVLNTNNVTVNTEGMLTWTMQPADNAIIGANSPAIERHNALFEWTYGLAGIYSGKHEVYIHVTNLDQVS